jgi:uncharacterized protein (DUF486 family)
MKFKIGISETLLIIACNLLTGFTIHTIIKEGKSLPLIIILVVTFGISLIILFKNRQIEK